MAPSEVPELNQPTATDFSLSGNHSATAFMPEGMAAASVKPISARKPASDSQPVAPACSTPASDHSTPNRAKPMRSPIRSTTKPQTGCMIV
ncbi:hypothetical protein J2S30_003468 [Herbaspirillum rubrisubalbicans]|nr:hypothetical protein [Herbaspirillum rubrisubalbicans]